jgi:hypothetical protein
MILWLIHLLIFILLSVPVLAQPVDEYMEYEGEIISQINIRILNVSGPSVEEGQNGTPTFLGNIGNKLQFCFRLPGIWF